MELLKKLMEGDNNFTNKNSTTKRTVAMVYTKDKTLKGSFNIVNNVGRYAIIYLSDFELEVKSSGNVILSNNVGSLVAFNSNVTFIGCVEFVNNHPKQSSTTTDTFQKGSAITPFQSRTYFNGNCNLQYNCAENVGGLFSTESKMVM